jgi:hypothetical protein
MPKQRQLLAMKLHDRQLRVQKLNDQGKKIGKPTNWTVRKRSALPREPFFKVIGFIRSRIKRSEPASMEEMREAISSALEQAGAAFGFKAKHGSKHADVYWVCKRQVICAWQLHEDCLDEDRVEQVLDSSALLRIAVVFKKSGYFEITPLKARLE